MNRGVDGLRLDVINLFEPELSRVLILAVALLPMVARIHEYLREMSRDVFTAA